MKFAKRSNTVPKDNFFGQNLIDIAKSEKATLTRQKGKALEKNFIDNEVNFHERSISTFATILIPQTQNSELSYLLLSTIPMLDHHLEMAKSLQQSKP